MRKWQRKKKRLIATSGRTMGDNMTKDPEITRV
jgi:hypothetical protein